MTIALFAIDADNAQFAGRREPGRFPFGRCCRLARAGCRKQCGLDLVSCCRIAERKLFDLASTELDEFQRETLFATLTECIKRPVFARDESLDFRFALANHAQRGALYTTG